MRMTATCVLLGLLLATPVRPAIPDALVADHHAADGFDDIPDSYFQQVRDHYRFFYGHTSHGSQICTGIDMLAAQDPGLMADVTMTEFGSDLGTLGDTAWVVVTRSYLATHPECNVVLWSWCGGVSTNTPAGIDAYLNAMNRLESDHPGVIFVYMTGHLDGTGPTGALWQNNDRIRAWCSAHGKVLFDFADIESWNPDGVSFPNGTDACAWCSDWCATHTCPACGDCAHSHCFNCYRKARAFWWMMARAIGWVPPELLGGTGDLGRPGPAHPNPFGRATTLSFSLAESGQVRVQIVDITGRLVATLADAYLAAGRHDFTWEGRTASGQFAPAGVYFARCSGPGRARTERIVLVR